MSASTKDPSVKPPDKSQERKPFEAGLVYSADGKGALEIMDSDTLGRRTDALTKLGYDVHSTTVGEVSLVVILPGTQKHTHGVSEVKTPTAAQLEAVKKLEADQAKADADAKAKAAKEAKP